MEQHPVPSQISSFEFRLVGDMTLKQFCELAGGLVVAFVFYSSSLSWFLKWPFVITFALLGVGLAFFPVEDRPLETWVMAFLKAIYSPTQYLWKKTIQIPSFLEERPPLSTLKIPEKITPQDRSRLAEYISSIPEKEDALEQREQMSLTNINNLFSLSPLPAGLVSQVKPIPVKEEISEVKVRKLHQISDIKVIREVPLNNVDMPLPNIKPISFNTIDMSQPLPNPPVENKQTKEAVFDPSLPMPSAPTVPNVLVGMVLDNQGKIIEGVIMEIRDERGTPVRALKTNKLGQFRTATPLSNGAYEIELEKEGYSFDNVKIMLRGEILELIQIKAK